MALSLKRVCETRRAPGTLPRFLARCSRTGLVHRRGSWLSIDFPLPTVDGTMTSAISFFAARSIRLDWTLGSRLDLQTVPRPSESSIRRGVLEESPRASQTSWTSAIWCNTAARFPRHAREGSSLHFASTRIVETRRRFNRADQIGSLIRGLGQPDPRVVIPLDTP